MKKRIVGIISFVCVVVEKLFYIGIIYNNER